MVKYTCIEETKGYWYAWNVVEGNIIACEDVINACNRYMEDLEKIKNEDWGYYFDLDQASRIENVAHCLKFTGGAKARQPIDLAPPQSFVLENLYCWRFKNNHNKRRFRSAMLMKARKNAKTFDMAFIAILAMLDEDEAEVYSVASKKDQARLSFRQCRSMIGSNNKLKKKFKLNRNEIRLLKNESIFQYLASEEKTLDGTSVSVGIIDEAFVTPEGVRSSISSGTGARLSPLIVCISTSYDVKMVGNWAYEEMQYTKKVNSGEFKNERHFGLIYQLDNVVEVDCPEMWEKANPLIPYSDTLLEDLRETYIKAKNSLSLLRNFKIKNMNLILDGVSIDKYLSLPAYEGNTVPVIDFRGKYVFYGLDLSITTDLCAVSKCAWNEDTEKYEFQVHAFLPKAHIEELEVRDGIPYRQYEEEGYISLIDGEVIDDDYVYEWIKKDAEYSGSEIAMIAYDPYNSDEIMKMCEVEGIRTLHISQGYRMLSGPTKKFRTKMYKSQLEFQSNPIMSWCVSNAITAKDRFGNEILDKLKSVQKIDLLAASIFCFLACDAKKDEYYGRDYDDNII